MYRLRHFKEIYGKCYCEKADSFANYTIYDFRYLTFGDLINNSIQVFIPCKKIYLCWLYWYVLLMSFMKLVNSLHEFYITFETEKPLHPFRYKPLYIITTQWQYRVRRVFGLFISIVDCFLICGILTMKPRFMEPWILVQFSTLALELVLWITDVFCGIYVPSCNDFVWFLIVYFNSVCVRCIRKIFTDAISEGRTEGYSLL